MLPTSETTYSLIALGADGRADAWYVPRGSPAEQTARLCEYAATELKAGLLAELEGLLTDAPRTLPEGASLTRVVLPQSLEAGAASAAWTTAGPPR